MKWRWPWQRDAAAAVEPAAARPEAAHHARSAQVQWLSWDGGTLRCTVSAPAAFTPVLFLDGVEFQRFEAGAGERVLECAFAFSPTGNAELEFRAGTDSTALDPPWRVRFGETATPGTDAWTQAPRFLAPLAGTPRLPARDWGELPDVAIVVPIYNAAASVRRCLDALERWTLPQARWILVDDGSTEPEIAELLARHARRRGASVERHERNRGYTGAVNTGIAAAGRADVVLLNSDTEVGPRWLQALRLAAYGDASIGTVTAVSDNAGAFSVPEPERYCPIPERWSLAEAQRAVLQQAGLCFPELPTGNGFCMYVKREVIDRVGVMDADAFPAGYGEENDFCQRAIAAGRRNVVAGHVLVRHERSASFGDARRAALGAQGMAVLRARWPRYEADVGATLFGYERRVLDYRIRRTYADSDGRYAAAPPRPRVLLAGFANAPSAFTDAAREEAFVLHDGPRLELLGAKTGERLSATPDGGADESARDRQLRAWLLACAIERVAIDCTADATFTARVADCAASLDIPVSIVS